MHHDRALLKWQSVSHLLDSTVANRDNVYICLSKHLYIAGPVAIGECGKVATTLLVTGKYLLKNDMLITIERQGKGLGNIA